MTDWQREAISPYYSDSWLTVYQGDCREVMAAMEPESVHCVVTSPPYWGLRDYGIDERGIGLEPTPEEYVANMVAVFREVRRVLRKDGTCWVNLGDSYAGGGNGVSTNPKFRGGNGDYTGQGVGRRPGMKPKDLVGIPWRVAFALQADGWYLRSDIIWSKPNPMPESVTDRPTKAHEYLFLLSKSPRYYYDADAVREPHRWQDADLLATNAQARQGFRLAQRREAGDEAAVRTQPAIGREKGRGKNGNAESEFSASEAGRNLRSVWSIATQPYPGAHFATFPEKLVEPCVKAGTSERGVCPECGAPWVREVQRSRTDTRPGLDVKLREITDGNAARTGRGGDYSVTTTGWHPSCAHGRYTDAVGVTHMKQSVNGCVNCERRWSEHLAPVPATVMDPFAGSGTVGRVAQRLGRRAVLIDLSGEYLTQAMKRNQDIPLGLETA